MTGAHAAVGEAGEAVTFWDLKWKLPPSKSLTASTLRVPVGNASSLTQNGGLVLTLSALKFPSPGSVDLIYASSDRGWSAFHSVRGGVSVDMVGNDVDGSGVDDAANLKDAACPGAGFLHGIGFLLVLALSAFAAA